MGAAKSLSNLMKTSAKVASALDWKKVGGSVLSLDIRRDHIGLAVGSHPSNEEEPEHLHPIPLRFESDGNKKVIGSEVIEQLQEVVKEHNVCGVLVSWPLEKEGRLGAPCGRVLHTLDSLVANSTILSPSRPFCLWDVNHVPPEPEDEWGRCAIYGRKCNKTSIRIAGEEQYDDEHGDSLAADMWSDFCRRHWPELCQEQQEYQAATVSGGYSQSKSNDEWMPDFEGSSGYMKVALL